MNLTYLTKMANTNKTALAKAVGVSLTALSNYEKGKNSPTLKVLVKMSEFLNCSLETLAGLDNKNIVDKKMLSEEKQKLIDEILNLESEDVPKVSSFIAGIKSTK